MNCEQLLPAVAAALLSDLIPFQVQTHMPSLNNPKLELRSTYNSSRIPRRNIPKRSCKAPTDFSERRIGAVGEGAYLYSVQSHFKLNTKHWTQDLNIGKPSLSKLQISLDPKFVSVLQGPKSYRGSSASHSYGVCTVTILNLQMNWLQVKLNYQTLLCCGNPHPIVQHTIRIQLPILVAIFRAVFLHSVFYSFSTSSSANIIV
ncbi:hypothetical protein KIL84_008414 [Mauremys mutica]|uniref:Uncharacterized protein n=1 Tax=Mauremys mutica TaxID=74926 RepID=A0A9D3XA88_9SAUR|nr:hypothetical protein KIL84_008414 [Mauremys mutica]